jgi:hypothetical protein
MIKTKFCQILKNLIDTNTIDLRTSGWIERVKEGTTDGLNRRDKELIDETSE